MRVWERGAGITRACGSGACAALVAAVRRGLAERRAEVVLDGGMLDIEWREDGHVLYDGPGRDQLRGHASTRPLIGRLSMSAATRSSPSAAGSTPSKPR